MFIDVSPQEARKGVAPTIRVATFSSERIEGKPDQDPEHFETAAQLALEDATANGHGSIAFGGVAEFITAGGHRQIGYQYVWTFTAHNPIGIDEQASIRE